jgi:hypothetical protein
MHLGAYTIENEVASYSIVEDRAHLQMQALSIETPIVHTLSTQQIKKNKNFHSFLYSKEFQYIHNNSATG